MTKRKKTILIVAAAHLAVSFLAFCQLMSGMAPATGNTHIPHTILDVVLGIPSLLIVGPVIPLMFVHPVALIVGAPIHSLLWGVLLTWLFPKWKKWRERKTEPEVRQVSSEAAPSASPAEPST